MYNQVVEDIVDVLVAKTQNQDRDFFRLQTNFFLTLMASNMGVKINCHLTGTIPVNFYGVSCATSGSGKGFATNLLEHELLSGFRDHFVEDTLVKKTAISIDSEAAIRAARLGITQQEAEDKLNRELASYGAFKFTFDSATTPAIKQFRHALLLRKLGALNFIIDEVGANLRANLEPLYAFLELYDKGLIKDRLIKSTQESVRYQEVVGATPANLLMFGTPSKLFDGAGVEADFFELLSMGMARRCFFAMSDRDTQFHKMDVEALYNQMVNSQQNSTIEHLALRFQNLAQVQLANLVLDVDKQVTMELLEYRAKCEEMAAELPEHQEILKAEISHRYFKALKLAGAYAFIEGSMNITSKHLSEAIAFADNSGIALKRMMSREKPYERLAKFIADGRGKEFTQVDLVAELPFYKGTASAKNELMNMAIAWGYRNNIVIRKQINDGIELISGESLDETDMEKLIVATGTQLANGYNNFNAPWSQIPALVQQPNLNWLNHHTSDGNRRKESMVAGFNLVVLDIDGTASLNEVRTLLEDYAYVIHTTKRHGIPDPNTGKVCDRFRVILPTNYVLKLTNDDFTQFMKNFANWFPVQLDAQTFQPSRKWACTEGCQVFVNEGQPLDVLPFIPKTSRETQFHNQVKNLGSLDNIERWFAARMEANGRNNELLKYALLLADSGKSLYEVQNCVLEFNKKLSEPLEQQEIETTIFKTVQKHYN